MKLAIRNLAARLTIIIALCVSALFCPRAADAYSVLSHEEVVDMAWNDRIVPMLRARFPRMTEDDIRQAHAYAYGGSVIQDIGYYPFGAHYFSDLLHYVRPDEFVNALIRDSTTPDEYAFALGALAHFCGDIIGHPVINEITAEENPPLRHRFGHAVTYAEDPLAHLRTEFGFDVVEVAQGHYSQENYRDFVGFQVSKTLLERAFQETYGIPVSDVMKHEDLAIASYRRAVSSLIPKMTKIAFVSYKSRIQQATPGMNQNKFLFRLNQTEFKRQFGTDYYHVGIRGHIASFFLHIVPKIGPFKALKVTLPTSHELDGYIRSINSTVDRFRIYLGEIHAAPAPLAPPDEKDAEEARKAAAKVARDVQEANRQAAEEQDPAEKAELEKVAANVQKTSERADAAADRTEARVVAAERAAGPDGVLKSANRIPLGTPVQPPSTPNLPELDLDTGGPSGFGEYPLADETYARLLKELVQAAGNFAPAQSAAAQFAPAQPAASAAPHVDPVVASDIERFFSHPAPPTLSPQFRKNAKKQAALERSVEADLAALKILSPPPAP